MNETFLVLLLTAISCGLIGSFLVLRKLSMISDAISHSVLLGIVLAYFVTKDVSSSWLIIGAALFGVLTVFSIEMLASAGMIKKDDAVGIVFPFFFALAVILITRYAHNVHLDVDMVLMGEVILSSLNRVEILGFSLPKALVQMSLMLLINLSFIMIFFKELKMSTFDQEFATVSGFSSILLFYGLMSLASLTSVVAFDAVGAILVISFLITPGATAYLITKSLKTTLLLTVLIASINAAFGFLLSIWLNVSMSGMTAFVAGVIFFLVFLFHREGMITTIFRRRQRKKELRLDLLLVHVGNHRNTPQALVELGLDSLSIHLNWKNEDLVKAIETLQSRDLLLRDEEKRMVDLTKKGLEHYQELKLRYGL